MHFVSALTGSGSASGDPRKVYIIVPRARAYLADLLAKAVEGRKDVEVIVDRRRRDRRTEEQPVPVERRRMERRQPKEELVEVVLGRISLSGGRPEGQP